VSTSLVERLCSNAKNLLGQVTTFVCLTNSKLKEKRERGKEENRVDRGPSKGGRLTSS